MFITYLGGISYKLIVYYKTGYCLNIVLLFYFYNAPHDLYQRWYAAGIMLPYFHGHSNFPLDRYTGFIWLPADEGTTTTPEQERRYGELASWVKTQDDDRTTGTGREGIFMEKLKKHHLWRFTSSPL